MKCENRRSKTFRAPGAVCLLAALVAAAAAMKDSPDVQFREQEKEVRADRAALLARQHGARPVQRTMKALAESTAERPAHVRILFYGQSIVGQRWHPLVVDELKRRYPTAVIEADNLAIGGFESPRLIRTAESDLYPAYPDLVFFHVYGPMDKYEDIVRKLRETTTAEIVLWTSHLRASDCDTREKIESAARTWDVRSEKIADIASRYGCLFVDLRTKWSRMMLEKGYQPKDVLGDTVHMKTDGPGFPAYARFLAEELVRLDGTDGQREFSGRIETVPVSDPRVRKEADGSLSLAFDGNRVVAVSDGRGKGSCRLELDGRDVGEFAEMYYTTRPSTIVSWMPMIRHVDIAAGARPVAEDWTLTYLEGTDPLGKPLHFKVEGSVTGFDGEGWSTNDFRSTSGRAVIAQSDFDCVWQYGYFLKNSKGDARLAKPGQTIRWSVKPLFAAPFAAAPAGTETTLVQNCANASHWLVVRPDAGATAGIASFIVYRPAALCPAP